MRVTTKGQVTIPLPVRKKMGITAHSEVTFEEAEDGRFFLKKLRPRRAEDSRFRTAHRGRKLTMTSEEILELTRG